MSWNSITWRYRQKTTIWHNLMKTMLKLKLMKTILGFNLMKLYVFQIDEKCAVEPSAFLAMCNTTILQQCQENFFKVLGNSEAP